MAKAEGDAEAKAEETESDREGVRRSPDPFTRGWFFIPDRL